MSVAFWTPTDAERETGFDRFKVVDLAKAAGLAPVYSRKSGRGSMHFYDATELRKCIDAHLESEAVKAQQVAAIAAASKTPTSAPRVDLSPVNQALAELYEQVESLTEQVKTLHNQNAVLLRTVERLSADSEGRLMKMLNQMANGIAQVSGQLTVSQMRQEPPEPVKPNLLPTQPKVVLREDSPPVAVPPQGERTALAEALAKSLPAAKPRVLVVGILPSQTAEITREFGAEIDLRYAALGDLRPGTTLPGLTTSDAVVVMMKNASRLGAGLKGDNVIKVNGGSSSLKVALTELYVKLSDKRKGAACSAA